MNKILAIYFDENYLIAGVEPFPGKFQQLSKSGNSRFPFYFFIDNIARQIDYSFLYRSDYENGKDGFIGDWMNQVADPAKKYLWYDYQCDYVDLLSVILQDIKNQYYSIMKSHGTGFDDKPAIPVNLAFSDNISPSAQAILKKFLASQNFNADHPEIVLPVILTTAYLEKNKLIGRDKKYAFVEATGSHLNMSIIKVNQDYSKERPVFKKFADFGIDPRIHVIARKIVDDVNKQEGLLSDGNAISKEYKRHQTKAEKIIELLKNFKKPYIRIETTFAIEPARKMVTTLAIDEIERLAALHAQQFSRLFNDYFLAENQLNLQQIERILLVGNTLNNQLVRSEFEKFGSSKLTFFTNDELDLILKQLLVEESEATSFLSAGTIEEKQVKGEVLALNISSLKHGNRLRLHCFDPSPGKGQETQELEYLGNNKFKVISSNRTLNSIIGGTITAVSLVWNSGMNVEFLVELNKQKGIFKTRPLVKAEIL